MTLGLWSILKQMLAKNISHTPSSPPLPRCSKKNCVNVWAEMNRVVLYEQIWIYWLITTLRRFQTRACFWPRTSWGWRMLWSTMQLWWIPGKQQGCSVPNLSGRCLVAPEWICSNCSTSDMRRLRSSCYATHSRESYMWRNVKRGNDLWSVAYDNVLDEMHLLAVTLVSQWAIDSFRCDAIVCISELCELVTMLSMLFCYIILPKVVVTNLHSCSLG